MPVLKVSCCRSATFLRKYYNTNAFGMILSLPTALAVLLLTEKDYVTDKTSNTRQADIWSVEKLLDNSTITTANSKNDIAYCYFAYNILGFTPLDAFFCPP